MKKIRTHPLKLKVILTAITAAAVMAASGVLVSFLTYSTSMDRHYKDFASGIAKTAASQMDADKISAYYKALKSGADPAEIKDGDYERMLKILYDVKGAMGVKYLYIQILEGDTAVYIMDADDSEKACELGQRSPVSTAVINAKNPQNGIPSFISSGEFGWLCSSMEPIYDSVGKPVALVGVDISMEKIMGDRQNYLFCVIAVLFVCTLAITLVILRIINSSVVKPITTLNKGINDVAEGKLDHLVDIRTGDEIEALGHSFNKMTRELLLYTQSLKKITAEKERISAELELARSIQTSMLPSIFPPFPHRSEFDIFASMTPAKEVGGDFYDFFLVDDNHLALVMADVSGKGVPAALFMVIAKTLLKNCAQDGLSPKQIFQKVNGQLCENNKEQLFVTAWLGILEISTGKITAANAGHEYPAIKRAAGAYELYKDNHGFVLGGMESSVYSEYELFLSSGDKLFLYTDGVTEATNEKNELYGTAKMLETLNRLKSADAHDTLKLLKEDIEDFAGERPPFDDTTMLCLELKDNGNFMKEMDFKPQPLSIHQATAFVESELKAASATDSAVARVNIITDEIFSNILSYGQATRITVGCGVKHDTLTLVFRDNGIPFNPLAKTDPDISLPIKERESGGLGILITKKLADTVAYEYRDGLNILLLTKNLK